MISLTECSAAITACTQEATDNFDLHGKLLWSNYIFPIPIDAWSPKIPIIGLALGEVQNALNQ